MNRLEHILFCISEECNEVGQRASKAARFTMEEKQAGQGMNNGQRLVQEFNDLYAMMELLQEGGQIRKIIDRKMIDEKKKKFEKYLKYSHEQGTF